MHAPTASHKPSTHAIVRTVLACVLLLLLAVLTRNLYGHLSGVAAPLQAAVHEDEGHSANAHLLEVHQDNDADGDASSSIRGDYDPRKMNDALKDSLWLDDGAAMRHSGPHCVCPQIVHCRDESIEEQCLRYMANHSNILSLRFDSSIMRGNNKKKGGAAQRRAKAPAFLVQYEDACVRGVARARTELLPHAPESEYLAYDFDRALHFFRVPPTTILWVPVSLIRKSAANAAELQWLERAVLGPAQRRGAIIRHALGSSSTSPSAEPIEIMYLSVQLFIFSTRPAAGTPLQVHESLLTVLRYDDLYRRATHFVMERDQYVDEANMFEPEHVEDNNDDDGAETGGRAHKNSGKTSGGGGGLSSMTTSSSSPLLDSKGKRRRIRWRSNFSANVALTASKISALLVDFAEQCARKLAFLRRVGQFHRDRALQGDYGLAEQQKAERQLRASGANGGAGAGTIDDPNNHLAEDVVDFGARAQEYTDEAEKLADLLLTDRHLPQAFTVLLSHVADRAVFDAIVGSDVSPSVHGGEGPLQSRSARVYLLRTDQVPPQCLGRNHPEDMVEIDNSGRPTLFQAPSFPKQSLLFSNKHNPYGPGENDGDEDARLHGGDLAADEARARGLRGRRFLMPIWIANEGCLRRRGFLSPAFRGSDPSVPGSVCLFRGRTWRVVNRAIDGDGAAWRTLLRRRVPKQILARPGSDKVFDFVEERLKRIVEHQKLCMQVLGPENHVLVW